MIAAFVQLQIYNSKQKFQFSPFTDITSAEYLYDTRGAASAASVCIGLLPGMEHSCGLLVCVPTCNKKIDQKVQTTQDGQKPKEVINMSIVQVIRNPSCLSMPCCNGSYNGNQKSTQVTA